MSALPAQFARFAVVGGLATLVHVTIGLSLAEGLGVAPWPANLVAFSTAVLVSYFGNQHWTFGARSRGLERLPRFLAIALMGLALNQALVYGLVDLLGWRYPAALAVVVTVVPLLSFTLNRTWVFAARPAAGGPR
jgi:putative flippase GtrA